MTLRHTQSPGQSASAAQNAVQKDSRGSSQSGRQAQPAHAALRERLYAKDWVRAGRRAGPGPGRVRRSTKSPPRLGVVGSSSFSPSMARGVDGPRELSEAGPSCTGA